MPRRGRPGKAAEHPRRGATRTFLASGFGAVSMDAIAREAGASKATLYAYFASKEELFGAVVASEGERYFRGFSAGELDPAAVEASLTEIAQRFLQLVLSPDVIAINRIIVGEVTRFPALAEVFWQAGPERIRVQVEGFLRRATEAGTLEHSRSAWRRRAVRLAGARRNPSAQRCCWGSGRRPGDAAAAAERRSPRSCKAFGEGGA